MRFTSPRAVCLAVVTVTTLSVACVDRRFVIQTNPPGAQIDVDGTPLGVSPVDSQYIYAGDRVVTASAPGRETVKQRVRLKAKWYQYPPLDFVAEILYPGRIEDVRYIYLELPPARTVSDQELLGQGENLRAKRHEPAAPLGAERRRPAAGDDRGSDDPARGAAAAGRQPGRAGGPARAGDDAAAAGEPARRRRAGGRDSALTAWSPGSTRGIFLAPRSGAKSICRRPLGFGLQPGFWEQEKCPG